MTSNNDYVCGDCGHKQDSMRRPCGSCGSNRVVTIKFAEEHFGSDWEQKCFPDRVPGGLDSVDTYVTVKQCILVPRVPLFSSFVYRGPAGIDSFEFGFDDGRRFKVDFTTNTITLLNTDEKRTFFVDEDHIMFRPFLRPLSSIG